MDNDFQTIFQETNQLLDHFEKFSEVMINHVFPKFETKFKEDEEQGLWTYVKENNGIDYSM